MNDPSYAGNPYAAPQARSYDVPVSSGLGPDGVPLTTGLFTPNHVVLATFLGTPFAGAAVMALNEHRLARKGNAVLALLAGAVATGLMFAIGFIVPSGVPTFPLGIASLLVMGAIARAKQGQVVHRHLVVGGKRASGWAAAGIALLSLIAVFVPLVAVLVAAELVLGH